MSPHDPDGRRGATRRQFLLGGAVAGAGAAAAIGVDLALNRSSDAAVPEETATAAGGQNGGDTVPFYGAHQAGVDTDAQAHSTFVALDLNDDVDRDGLARLLRILTDDAARLTQGNAALADSEPELAERPARLTITFGFGPGLVARAGGAAPDWLAPLPAFSIDRLDDAFCDGDLALQFASDDPITLAHATRMLLKDARSFASVRWTQQGFRRAYGTERPGTTMRNLFGQVDGTSNVQPGTSDFDDVVWSDGASGGASWMAGGTGMVVRRIAMNLDKWDLLDRSGRESSVGRDLAVGAPLTGEKETDEPDFTAVTSIGFPVIAQFAHIRRARDGEAQPTERIFRRAYNYDERSAGESVSNAGLIFVAFQADVERQFTPIQQRLSDLDLLNEWTTPIGSAVFAVPPGCADGGFIGDTLLV